MSNTKLNLKSYKNERDFDYKDIQLSVTGENNWYFRGASIVQKSGRITEEKEGDRIIVKKNFFSTEFHSVRANGENIPEIGCYYFIYVTEGGSYIGHKMFVPGTSAAKIFETAKDIKSFFGKEPLAKELYQALVKSNPHLASDLLGDYMNVIK